MQQTAQIQSKSLEANAQAQAKANSAAADVSYVNVPSYKIDYTVVHDHHEHKYYDPQAHTFFYTTYTTQRQVFKSDNAGQIQIVEDQDSMFNKIRDDLTNVIIVLRQDSQTQETQLNSTLDIVQQNVQEGVSLTSTLKQLMRQALLSK